MVLEILDFSESKAFVFFNWQKVNRKSTKKSWLKIEHLPKKMKIEKCPHRCHGKLIKLSEDPIFKKCAKEVLNASIAAATYITLLRKNVLKSRYDYKVNNTSSLPSYPPTISTWQK